VLRSESNDRKVLALIASAGLRCAPACIRSCATVPLSRRLPGRRPRCLGLTRSRGLTRAPRLWRRCGRDGSSGWSNSLGRGTARTARAASFAEVAEYPQRWCLGLLVLGLYGCWRGLGG